MTASGAPWSEEQLRRSVPAQLQSAVEGFLARLPIGYREQTTPDEAAADLAEISALGGLSAQVETSPAGSGGVEGDSASSEGRVASSHSFMGSPHRLDVRPSDGPERTFRLRRFGFARMELTSTLPLLESFGLVVVESVPFGLAAGASGEPVVHIDDIGVRTDSPSGPETLRFVPSVHGPRLVEAIEMSAGGRADIDILNRLVITAGLYWHQVLVLRAYLRYWHQLVPDTAWSDIVEPLTGHPDVARALVAYFQARFDPLGAGGAGSGSRERAMCLAQLDLVEYLGDDRVLRALLGLVEATLRTNYFVGGAPGPPAGGRPLVLKLDSAAVSDMQPPRPLVETFVHGPSVEGIHIRAGLVARGGIRWSERPGDFRTEVIDLASAQVKKNAVIVPTGAKGGFVCRSQGPASLQPLGKYRPRPEDVRAAYELYVRALLEITDNIEGGRVAAPSGVVCADGPDPYLVIAADKGTATFSDLANSLSEDAGFWLGDAFASGGSRGYDHKAMGITARGAWVAVRRHFRELGIDVATDPIRVAGVGDMSGDVFGNGMLQSRAIRLVAAFDHRHVFVDPEPEPGSSFEERRRLAAMGQSSWADYRKELISEGGGVWPRDTKAIHLSDQARAALGIAEESLSPPQLIRAILCAPVDLLWFGGIGTFVKAPDEADSDVADHPDDEVRVTSNLVRARVIAEGANLAVTQKARIRYSRRGGRINADFIDNAAGVATSDREVNLKILLAEAVEAGRLVAAGRDRYLAEAEPEVAFEVLRQVDHSVAALNRAASTSATDLDAYESLIDSLELGGRLHREVEVLPDRDEFRVRRAAGAGLIRPELATILAYAKSDLEAAIGKSAWVSDQVLLDSVVPYFPAAIARDFGDLVPGHRLYPLLVATDIAGEIVDQMGIVWAHDLAAELGRGLDEVATVFWVARQVTGAGSLWMDLEKASTDPAMGLTAQAEAVLHTSVAGAVSALVRHYLLTEVPLRPAALASRDGLLSSEERSGREAVTMTEVGRDGEMPPGWRDLKIPEVMAERFLSAGRVLELVQTSELSRKTGRTASECAQALRALEDVAGLEDLISRVTASFDESPPPERLRVWQARALLDDLASWQRRAVAAALSGAPPGGVGPRQSVERWVGSRGGAFARLGELEAATRAGSDPLLVGALALRRLEGALDQPGAAS